MKLRYRFFLAFAFLLTLVLLVQLFRLQVVAHKQYDALAKRNIARTLLLPAPRGILWDRNGVHLAKNESLFSILLIPSQVEDVDQLAQLLAKVLKGSFGRYRERIAARAHSSEPMVLAEAVPLAAVTTLAEYSPLPGLFIRIRPVRTYPHGALAAHVLGYVGEVSPEELAHPESEYILGEIVGKLGLEKTVNLALRGKVGFERVQIVGERTSAELLPSQEPTPGRDFFLTLDLTLQQSIEQAIRGLSAAVVVLDPKQGEILAMASAPDFDPNWFVGSISKQHWHALQSMGHPFLNRALSVYPPGSTFKVITAGAALEEGVIRPGETFFCPGSFQLGNRKAYCWKRSGHGRVDLKEALVWSCDVAFYQIALRLGPKRLADYAVKCGLGEKTGVDLPGEMKGRVPNEAWKEKRFGDRWYDGDTINFGIGQGYVQASPLQMARLYAAIANGGTLLFPHVVRGEKGQHENVSAGAIHNHGTIRSGRLPFRTETLAFLKDALQAVVERGTGRAARVTNLAVAGKTGTAEDPPRKPHAWFLCFAPVENPELVLSIFVEEGEHGDRVAARLAGQILRAWHIR